MLIFSQIKQHKRSPNQEVALPLFWFLIFHIKNLSAYNLEYAIWSVFYF